VVSEETQTPSQPLSGPLRARYPPPTASPFQDLGWHPGHPGARRPGSGVPPQACNPGV